MLLTSSRLHCSAAPLLWFGRRGAFAAPHPAKVRKGGEDAFLVHTSGVGVADGVGGYASCGVDPGVYTRNVMRYSLGVLQEDNDRGTVTAMQALTRGYIEAEKQNQPGGCPVTLVTLLGGRFASILNLGDCGTICLRSSKLFFATQPQQHSFNCPYQLPEDPPSAGDCTTLEVSEGDVFLCASDGLLDNVDTSDILKHLETVGQNTCQRVAEELAALACRNGADTTFDSPFAKQARAVGYRYMGGKQDDVTVVVAQLTQRTFAPEVCPQLITEFFDLRKK
uniref:Protein phosphatase n=1 Tax=Trypanosoma congolense (strain IL3000) TaxID=1068625 RepID=G0ULG8_TRYCI|nr:putative protein phosphatase 2C [Trypanosoma congolense IL3000]